MPRRGRPDPDKKSALPTLAPDTKCNGIVRSGLGYCKQPAGAGTDHVGQGRCKNHGGCNTVKHGRYSTVKSTELRDLIDHFHADPEILNIEHEVSVLRAIWVEWVNRYEAFIPALLAWHESFADPARTAEPKPRQVMDIADGYRIVSEITKAVERIEKIRAANAISAADYLRLQGQQGQAVERALERHFGSTAKGAAAKILNEIKDAWLSLRTA